MSRPSPGGGPFLFGRPVNDSPYCSLRGVLRSCDIMLLTFLQSCRIPFADLPRRPRAVCNNNNNNNNIRVRFHRSKSSSRSSTPPPAAAFAERQQPADGGEHEEGSEMFEEPVEEMVSAVRSCACACVCVWRVMRTTVATLSRRAAF